MKRIGSSRAIDENDLKRGRNLRIVGIGAPVLLTAFPVLLFVVLSVILSGSPIFAVSSFVLGLILGAVGFLLGLVVSGITLYRHQVWSAEMRDRIAANGIGADEIDWFTKELKPAEKRALKSLKALDPLIEDAYRETLASRLTASRIIRTTRRELQAAKRRESKLKLLKAENSASFLEQAREDAVKIGSIHTDAKQMLVEAESRLQMIEAAAARGGGLADTEVALKKLAARASQLPLALEEVRLREEAAAEISGGLSDAEDPMSQ